MDDVPDSDGEVFDFDKLTFETGWVPVTINFGDSMLDFVGYGKLTRSLNALCVEFETLRESLGPLIPAVGGKVIGRVKNDSGVTMLAAHIDKIGLCTTANKDKRIKSVENQTK